MDWKQYYTAYLPLTLWENFELRRKTSVTELCEVFRRSDLVISLDSGSTHLAWATQAPKIVSIFCGARIRYE